MKTAQPADLTLNRSIRIFISSTFKDMVEERNELMTHCWPQLRSFCKERYVDLIEVDMRWGISEDQSQRNETLKLCLDEIQKCHPFFIGLLGERYGWIPNEESFTLDLLEEQKWLKEIKDKSVTELEILHGVLRDYGMKRRSFFYFRDPEYAKGKGSDFISDSKTDIQKLNELKENIRLAKNSNQIYLKENYANPTELAKLVLEDLQKAIEIHFPIEQIPDALDRESTEHNVFAESRRKTYIGRKEYYDKLDQHAFADNTPLVVTGDSGIGKSALLANWAKDRRTKHPDDFIFEHYIGGTNQSADHWSLMNRLMGEIKKWTGDPGELPKSHDEILRDFGSWLVRLRMKAEQKNVKAILVIDALNQLEDKDHAHILGWLPEYPFFGSLRLVVSSLKRSIQEVLQERKWELYEVKALDPVERKSLITNYLKRYSKELDEKHKDIITSFAATNNPLYLKILLDELRVTGTHDGLEEKLKYYLKCTNIPELLNTILDRYKIDYEKVRPGLVSQTLGFIWSARRGLSESELLELLKPEGKDKLQQGIWNPLRSALDEFLVNKNGILNFSHTYIRDAVKEKFVNDLSAKDEYQLELADYFEKRVKITERSCDELPWLLKETESFERLRECLLDLDRFVEIYDNNENELRAYWIGIKEENKMGALYLGCWDKWITKGSILVDSVLFISSRLGNFLNDTGFFAEAKIIFETTLTVTEKYSGTNQSDLIGALNNLASVFRKTNRYDEAETLLRKALNMLENNDGNGNNDLGDTLNNLAVLFITTNRNSEAEALISRSLAIKEKNYGKDHPEFASALYTLAEIYRITNYPKDSINLLQRALSIIEKNYGNEHPDVADILNSLGILFLETSSEDEAEKLFLRALNIYEKSYGKDHLKIAMSLHNLADLYIVGFRYIEAESLLLRSLAINEEIYGKDHPDVADDLHSLAALFRETNRNLEAEKALKRSIKILETSFESEHPRLVGPINNLANLFRDTNRYTEAEELFLRALSILEKSYGKNHPIIAGTLINLNSLLQTRQRYSDAELYVIRALTIYEKNYGNEHEKTSIALLHLGFLFFITGQHLKAEPIYRRLIPLLEKLNGVDNISLTVPLRNLSNILVTSNRFLEAEPLLIRALSIDEFLFGAEHPDVAKDLYNMAVLLIGMKRYFEAEPLLRRSLRIYEINYGSTNEEIALALNNLAIVLKETNRIREVAPVLKSSLEILIQLSRTNGIRHIHLMMVANNYGSFLMKIGFTHDQAIDNIHRMAPDLFPYR